MGGLVLILKGGLGTCPQIIIENNTEMHHTKNWRRILNVTLIFTKNIDEQIHLLLIQNGL